MLIGVGTDYFKGGTGSSSRVVPGFDTKGEPKSYTVGALVQANYGKKPHFRIAGVPVGKIIAQEEAKAAELDAVKKLALENLEREKERKKRIETRFKSEDASSSFASSSLDGCLGGF